MNLAPYLAVLRTPRVPSLMLLMLFARIPATAAGMTITMHVLLGLERGYGAAGLVGAMATVGIAVGAPLMGLLTDRRGLRTMLLVSLVSEGLFWFVAPALSFPVLLVTCFVSGIAVMPVMQIGRQVITALVGEAGRRTALAMDSMAVEVAFMAGPALGVLLTTQWNSRVAMWTIGVSMVVFGLVLYAVNPPVRDDVDHGAPVPRREWLTGKLLGVLISAGGATFVLSGVEVAVVAGMRGLGLTDWTGALIAVMCVASLVGGFVYGGLPHVPPVWALMGVMGVLAMPIGLFGWSPWVLALALVPMNFLCAPTIAATGEAITRMTPGSARGEAMGLQGSAFTLGAALGAPLAGFVIDHSSPGWGYFVAGVGAVVIAVGSMVLGAAVKEPVGAALP
ncbi:putative MFS family arabinose efflux permease [Saccharothrix tamanrassetensis]|uniref:Putative MFS family arabinose efflux permease n=1 Tax=Saccharothrix tamanrassetensis TaxID=1051531 RepID=A0A841CSE2_9PSEU|nr:MFS transporter [Saccharothrix tamanrassetensis]MBB5958957.1 putative MFS family arabinose efflux permease [Saccharothrix tamanrassetensis]